MGHGAHKEEIEEFIDDCQNGLASLSTGSFDKHPGTTWIEDADQKGNDSADRRTSDEGIAASNPIADKPGGNIAENIPKHIPLGLPRELFTLVITYFRRNMTNSLSRKILRSIG